MVQRRNLKPTFGDALKRLKANVEQGNTRPYGIKVATVGEGTALESSAGTTLMLDGDRALEWQERTTLAAEVLAGATGTLADAELELSAAEGRLDAAEHDLYEADGRVEGAYKATADAKAELAAADAALASRASTLESWRTNTVTPTLTTLNSKIAGSAGTLKAAEDNLAALGTRTTAAEGRLTTAEANLSSTSSSLATTREELDGLELRVGDVSGATEAAQAAATAAQGTADSAISAAQAADSKAVTAQSAADAAKAAADAADAKALEANGLAASKGRVIYSSTAPTGEDANAANLWIRTSDNRPHTYANGTWTARVDKAATDAASAASAAQGTANEAKTAAATAQSAADAAASKANDALTAAGNAQATADGKNTVTYATTLGAPPASGRKAGDIHWVVTASSPYNIVEQWRHNGSAWFKASLDSQVIANLDVGKLTGVFADISKHLSAGSISSNLVMIGTGGNLFPDPTLTTTPIRNYIPDTWELAPGTAWDGNGAAFMIPAGTVQTGVYFGQSSANPAGRMAVTPGASYHIAARVKLSAAMTHSTGAAVYARVYKSGTNSFAFATPGTLYLDWDELEEVYGKREAPADTWLKVSGTVKIPDGYDQLVVGLYSNGHSGTVPAATWSAPTVEPAADGRLIVDGAVTAKAVDAESVAAAVGEFVKVKAANVEVTGTLAAEVARLMDAEARNLVVTGRVDLGRDAWAENLAAGKIAAASISVGQLTVPGGATIAQAVIDELYTRTFATKKLYAENVVIAGGYNLMPNGRGEVADKYPLRYSDVEHGADAAILAGTEFPGYFWTKSNVGKTTERIPVKPGAKYVLRASTRAELTNQRAYWQVRWIGADSTLIDSEYLVSNTPVGPTWVHMGPYVRTAPAGAATAYFSLYGNHTNGTQGGTAYWSGLEFVEQVDGELVVDGSIGAKHIAAESGIFAKVVANETLTAKNAFITGTFTASNANLIGTNVAEVLNVTGKLTARDAIIDGTLDVEQLNITESMATPILNAGSVTAKKGVFTEGLNAADATLIGTTMAEKIDVAELGTRLLTAKVLQTSTSATVGLKISDAGIVAYKPSSTAKLFDLDMAAGTLTMAGTYRSAPLGSAGIVIAHRDAYGTPTGAQLGVWFAHDGTAPGDPGDKYGTTAGAWVDTANLASSSYYPLNIRGMNGAGLHVWGDRITLLPNGTAAFLEAGTGKRLEVRGTGGTRIYAKRRDIGYTSDLDLWAEGAATLQTFNGGKLTLDSAGLMTIRSSQPIELYSGFVMTTTATDGWVVQSGGNFALRKLDGSPMTNAGTGTTLVLGEYGRIYKNSSSARYKTAIRPREELDERYLELPVFEFQYAEAKAKAEALENAPRPLTREQEADLAGLRVHLGTIAEVAVDYAPELVLYDEQGRPDGYQYDKDGTKLRPFVRELWHEHKATAEDVRELVALLPALRRLIFPQPSTDQ